MDPGLYLSTTKNFDGSPRRLGCSISATKKALENLLKTEQLFAMAHLKLRLDHLTKLIVFVRFFGERKIAVCWALIIGKQQSQYEIILPKLQEKNFEIFRDLFSEMMISDFKIGFISKNKKFYPIQPIMVAVFIIPRPFIVDFKP